MTRETEDRLLEKRAKMQRDMRKLVQRIVDARLQGERDHEAIAELARLSKREVEFTPPEFAAA